MMGLADIVDSVAADAVKDSAPAELDALAAEPEPQPEPEPAHQEAPEPFAAPPDEDEAEHETAAALSVAAAAAAEPVSTPASAIEVNDAHVPGSFSTEGRPLDSEVMTGHEASFEVTVDHGGSADLSEEDEIPPPGRSLAWAAGGVGLASLLAGGLFALVAVGVVLAAMYLFGDDAPSTEEPVDAPIEDLMPAEPAEPAEADASDEDEAAPSTEDSGATEEDSEATDAVSYTHLTLPTILRV